MKLQYIDPERLNSEHGSKGDAWISLVQGNRIEFKGRIG